MRSRINISLIRNRWLNCTSDHCLIRSTYQHQRITSRHHFRAFSTTSTSTYTSTSKFHPLYDVIIVGVGAHGSASLYEIARRGARVLGIESQSHVAHDKGSSHGETRIIRLAYMEHVNYVAYLHRAYTLWNELQQHTSTPLLTITGGLDIGHPQSRMVIGALRACHQHNLPHEVLTAKQMCQRFPAMSLRDPYIGIYQPQAGILYPEACIHTFVDVATKQYGAHMKYNTCVTDIQPYQHIDGTECVYAVTNKGERFATRRVILSNGAWLPHLLHSSNTILSQHTRTCTHLASHLFIPQRQVVGWFQPHQQQDAFKSQCIWVLDWEGADDSEEGVKNGTTPRGEGEGFYYGFPADGTGFKLGKYHHRHQTLSLHDLNNHQRLICDDIDRDTLATCVKHVFPGAWKDETSVKKMQSCIFTNTPDEHFVIDREPIPTLPQVSIVSACSGHGFKFASVIGEMMAELSLEGHTRHDIEWLSSKRFMTSS